MQQTYGSRPAAAPAVVGLILIAVGVAALVLREAGVNAFAWLGAWGWPFFVIVPGVVLLVAALVPAPPRGIGFATAGAVVTTVGGLLLYQDRTGHWESWAYAWALIPMFAGLAMALYGLFARARNLVTSGLWMVGIAAILFAVGAWYFERVFAGDPLPVDAGAWWPVIVIAVGAIMALRALLSPSRPTSTPDHSATNEPRPL